MAAYKKTRKYAEFQAAKKAKKVAKKTKDKNQPKRPMSAFMFFSNDMRPKVQAELGTTDFGPVRRKFLNCGKTLMLQRKQSMKPRTKKQRQNTQKLWRRTRKARNMLNTKKQLRNGSSR